MKARRMAFTGLVVFLLVSSAALAGDFDWMQDLNIRATADPSGFRAQLGARFKIGNAEINTVIGNVEKPADAYIMSLSSTGPVKARGGVCSRRAWASSRDQGSSMP
jgi:hypothetical protein